MNTHIVICLNVYKMFAEEIKFSKRSLHVTYFHCPTVSDMVLLLVSKPTILKKYW